MNTFDFVNKKIKIKNKIKTRMGRGQTNGRTDNVTTRPTRPRVGENLSKIKDRNIQIVQ